MSGSTLHGTLDQYRPLAYTALLNGQIYDAPEDVCSAMVKLVVDDLCTAARTLPKEQQDAFLHHVFKRMRQAN